MKEYEGKTMVEEEIMRGYKFVDQLLELNNSNTLTKTTSFVHNLVNNVINSFDNALFLMDKDKYIPTHKIQNHFSSIESLNFKQSSKTTSPRGCYKRRNLQITCEKVTQTPSEDGRQWRKYGQKNIINSPYSRNYYRCTHKFDERCVATKQVHRIQQNPPLYKTTYYGHHTCGNLSKPYNDTSSTFISFNNTFPTPTKQQCPFFSSLSPSPSSLISSPNLVEFKEEIPLSSLYDNDMISLDPTLDTSISSTMDISNISLESQHKDIMNDFLYDSLEFDDDLSHPFDEFW